MMIGGSRMVRAACTFAATVSCAYGAFLADLSTLNPNASIQWSQLGAAGDSIPQSFHASSSGFAVSGTFIGGAGGTIAAACPASGCDFASAPPGIDPGEFLIWTESTSGSGTGPLFFGLSTPVRGVGFYLQLTAPASFTASFFSGSATGSSSETVTSSPNGDPVFLGVLDAASDINSFAVQVASCTPNSPGGCNPSDFVIGTLFLATPVPEPSNLLTALLVSTISLFLWTRSSSTWKRKKNRALVLTSLLLVFFACPAGFLQAQSAIPYQAGDANLEDGASAVRNLPTPGLDFPAPQLSSVGLPIWNYRLISPLDSVSYGGYMVGQNPFNRGARTIVIPTILIPVIVNFHNTSSDFTASFDPSSTPDGGCTANQTALSLVENSPIFRDHDWIMNSVSVGLTQYIDAFQRANFWQYVQNTDDAYHTLLTYSEGDPLTINVDYTSPTLSAEVRVGVAGPCTNPSGSGTTNGGGMEGYVNISMVDEPVRQYIATHAVTPDQLPVFILYNVVMPELNRPGFFTGGYHRSLAGSPQVFTSPAQTYAVADFQTNFFYIKPNLDVSLLAHELGEWVNDPGGVNFTPAWGNIGQVSGCQNNLEVGDPLTGTNFPEIAGPNGFAYHVQELAFFSWFFRIPSIGAGSMFSSNGTLTSDAGLACQSSSATPDATDLTSGTDGSDLPFRLQFNE